MNDTRSHKSRGQSLVEFAIVIPLFLLIFVSIAEGGYYVVASTVVNHATHEGSRAGILSSTKMSNACSSVILSQMPDADQDGIRRKVKQSVAPVVRVSCASVDVVLKGSDGTVKSNDCDATCYSGRQADDRLLVRTNYTHVPLMGYVFPGLTFPAAAESELRVEGPAS